MPSRDTNWGRINAVLNGLVILLLSIGTWLMWSDRTERSAIRHELDRLKTQIEAHIGAVGAAKTGQTAGGQDGI